jgi:hypothetical protein
MNTIPTGGWEINAKINERHYLEDLAATGRDGDKMKPGLKQRIMTVEYIQLILDVKVY